MAQKFPDVGALEAEIGREETRLSDLRRRIRVMEIERDACTRERPARQPSRGAIRLGSWAVGFLVAQLAFGIIGRLIAEVVR